MRLMASKPAQAFCFLALTLSLLVPTDWAAAEPSEDQVAAIKSNCRSDYMSYCRSVPRGGAEAMQCLKKNIASLSAACQQAVKAATAAAPAKAPSAAPAAAAKQESAPAIPAQPSPAAAPTPSSETPAQGAEAKAQAPAESAKGGSASAPKEAAGSPSPASTQQAPKVVAPPAASSTAAGASAKAATGAETSTEQPSAKKSSDAPATALASPEETPIIGFIPPRKKLMILRNCRQDLDAYCPDVSYGEGRQLSCLVSNRASLSADCQGALAKLAR